MYEEKPPLPSSPPPEPTDSSRAVSFQLNSESPTNDYYASSAFHSEFHSSLGIRLYPVESTSYSSSSTSQHPTTFSWEIHPPSSMIVEESVKNGGARPITPRSIANSLDSLSECAQHITDSTANGDRSRSLGDLLSVADPDDSEAVRNGSYDALVSQGCSGLTDSGIGTGCLMREDIEDKPSSSSSPDRFATDVSSPDSFSYPAVSFASYDPVGNTENTNPFDCASRGHSSEDRKYSDLPAISEESEHEQSIHHIQSQPATRGSSREVTELSYPMLHCNSAPSNSTFANNNFAHRRVVSDDVSETTRLKRSEEIENMEKIGKFSFEKRSASTQNLKKGRCKSAVLVFQEDDDSDENYEVEEEKDDVDGYSKDNQMLISERSPHDDRSRKLRHYDNHSNLPSIASSNSSDKPPPVVLSRKVSGASTRSSPYRTATDQSWKDKMPPFSVSGHTMFSPQSLPTRPPFDGSSGTIGAGGSQRLSSLEVTTSDGTDGYPRFHHTIPSPPALIATSQLSAEISELHDSLMPLSEIYNSNRLSISSSVQTDVSSPKSQTSGANSSFVRRSLRKIMKRSSVSTSSLGGDDGLRNASLKRRASNVSSTFFASAQAHLKPRTKSLKKQRISKNKKEKSGSDTFTFGNLFRKKQPTSRPNLADIISDLDQRSTTSGKLMKGGSLTVGGSSRRSTSASILPMSGANETTPDSSSLDGLPDHISRMVSPSEPHHHSASSSNSNGTSSTHSLYAQLDRLWGKYDLFGKEEYQSWHEKYRHNTLSTKQVKKQDAIYELYLMEKRHCANIAFLLQGYRRRMLDENIISRQDMDVLIPDVLEPLLIFHLNVLERITKRMQDSYEVTTISDIIVEELAIDGGQHTRLCCDAYTDFGVAKERSDVLYHHLMNKNVKFAEFFKKTYSEEQLYKQYDFRPLITKIIGRATKYSLLLETIMKNEVPFSEHHDLTKSALETARKFAHKIDENLSMAHMSMKWEEVKAQIDPASTTNLYVSDPSVTNGSIRYNFDLNSLNAVSNRKLVHLGDAFIKMNTTKDGNSTHSSTISGKQQDRTSQCFLVLFDDIIVILIRKGNRQLTFMPDQGVMPVQSLLIRTAARGHSIMLISGTKPVLYEISFHNSSDRKKWVSHLEAAPKNLPPEGIRIVSSGDADGVLRDRVAAQQELEDKWLKRLEELFESRLPEEEALSRYLETRLHFFDDVRDHVSKLPFHNRSDISNRIREAVKSRFRELRRARVIPLNRLVERMNDSRDADLWSYFDEKADAADVLEKSSDLSEDSDNSGDSTRGGGAKPRRIQTFHGTSQPQTATGLGETKNCNIRRHTTVPRMNSDGGGTSSGTPVTSSSTTDRALIDDVDDEEDASIAIARGRGDVEIDRKTYGEMISDLPLRQTMRARRASTKLIKEVIALRRENHLLRNENALTKSQCAFLERTRTDGKMMTSTSATVDGSMEMLRKKEKEIREMQQQMLAEREELLEKQKSIDAQELEIQSKWAALQSRSTEQQVPTTPVHTRSSSSASHSQISSPTYKTAPTPLPSSSQNSEWSPMLASLATKTETKKLKK